ncbi:hypothetical protein BGZ58_010475 [Dissophora ornata]|nr:hypothetical protein BGZ58_010475 [Dissophora ornata]
MTLNHNDHFVVNAAQPSRRQIIEFKLSEEVLEEILNGNESIQLDMNQAVATLTGGRYVLKPETYKEVKIYDWKSYSAKEREIVVKNANLAFDKLGLGPDAPERDILFPEKTKRASPPLVAEGYHVVGNMDNSSSKWRSGGGGSESEGFDNGRMSSSSSSLLRPPVTQKRTSAKKSPAVSSMSSKKRLNPSSKASSSSGSKGSRQSTEKAVAAILEAVPVPNHSTRGATTPSGTLKPTMGGTPGTSIGSPTTTGGRRPSINGNGNGNSAPSLKKSSETKKSGSKETGGVGTGYKIPKVGSVATVQRKPQSPTFAVPPITTQAEYEDVSRRFLAKYQEMKALKVQIDRKKELFDQLGAELELAVGTEREAELKRKVQDAFGEDVVDRKVLRRTGEPRNGVSAERAAAAKAEQSHHLSVRSMAERYKSLHYEVETMKRALWEAGTAQAEKVGQSGPGSAGGGNG